MKLKILLLPLFVLPSLCNCNNINQEDNDYDGIANNEDLKPECNTFKGKLDTSDGYINDVSFKMDYRNFVDYDNKEFHNDLAILGSIIINDAPSYGCMSINADDVKNPNSNRDDNKAFYKTFGCPEDDIVSFEVNPDDYQQDKYDTTFGIFAHHQFTYNDKSHDVVFASIIGTHGNTEWVSNFDAGAYDSHYSNLETIQDDHPDWTNYNNHKGFDVASNRVYRDYLMPYINKYTKGEDVIIFLTGHSRGAAIANLLGARLEKENKYKSFTYTYAPPNSTFDEINANTYNSIFNISNNDDFVTKIPMDIWHCKLYGKEIIVKDIKNEWNTSIYSSEGKLLNSYDPLLDWETDKDTLKINSRSELYYNEDERNLMINEEFDNQDDALYEYNIIKEHMIFLKYNRYYNLNEPIQIEDKWVIKGYCSIGALFDIVNYILMDFKGDVTEVAELINILDNGWFSSILPYLIRIGIDGGANIKNAHIPLTYYLIAKNAH